MPQKKKQPPNVSEHKEQEWKIGLTVGTSVQSLIKSISIKEEKTDSPEVASEKLRLRELMLVLQKLTDAMGSEESDQADLEALFAQFMNLDRALFMQFLNNLVPPEEAASLSDIDLIKLIPAQLFRSRLAGDSSTDAPPPEDKKKKEKRG